MEKQGEVIYSFVHEYDPVEPESCKDNRVAGYLGDLGL